MAFSDAALGVRRKKTRRMIFHPADDCQSFGWLCDVMFFFWAATLKLKSALVLWMLLGACWFLGMANGRASLGFDSQLRHLDVNDVSTILFDSFKAKSHRCKVT